mmetsp:Transcript_73239/g.227163  ORF Transcript_73239/g.227163 Transcript_73239/m.227163 type:complete len:327 (-) Transcript_73239:12-992(-)
MFVMRLARSASADRFGRPGRSAPSVGQPGAVVVQELAGLLQRQPLGHGEEARDALLDREPGPPPAHVAHVCGHPAGADGGHGHALLLEANGQLGRHHVLRSLGDAVDARALGDAVLLGRLPGQADAALPRGDVEDLPHAQQGRQRLADLQRAHDVDLEDAQHLRLARDPGVRDGLVGVRRDGDARVVEEHLEAGAAALHRRQGIPPGALAVLQRAGEVQLHHGKAAAGPQPLAQGRQLPLGALGAAAGADHAPAGVHAVPGQREAYAPVAPRDEAREVPLRSRATAGGGVSHLPLLGGGALLAGLLVAPHAGHGCAGQITAAVAWT